MSRKSSFPGAYQPLSSFHDHTFMESPPARTVRILCEYLEPEDRFHRLNVNHTIVFFGSARTLPIREAISRRDTEKQAWEKAIDGEKNVLRAAYEVAERGVLLAQYHEDARELSKRITAWSKSSLRPAKRFYVCSGGGPGIMAAANQGADEAGGRSIGLNITLPFEQAPNPYQSKELSFEFHYFFMRKFWFAYLAKALVLFPGGFGTMDEMFELLTMLQTEKTTKTLPIILYGSDYWNDVLNFDAMVRWGTISPEDLSLFRLVDTVDDAFDYLKSELSRLYLSDKGTGNA